MYVSITVCVCLSVEYSLCIQESTTEYNYVCKLVLFADAAQLCDALHGVCTYVDVNCELIVFRDHGRLL